jgi:uncharacterized protein YbaR (Trm112 family)
MTGYTYSTSQKAAAIMGYRGDAIAIDFPCEIGFHCPVCKYELTDENNEYDERLAWSEYNAFLWCAVCNKDYPSALCMPDIDQAIEIFLKSVRDAKQRMATD